MIQCAQHNKRNTLYGKTRHGIHRTRYQIMPHMGRHIKKAPVALMKMRADTPLELLEALSLRAAKKNKQQCLSLNWPQAITSFDPQGCGWEHWTELYIPDGMPTAKYIELRPQDIELVLIYNSLHHVYTRHQYTHIPRPAPKQAASRHRRPCHSRSQYALHPAHTRSPIAQPTQCVAQILLRSLH